MKKLFALLAIAGLILVNVPMTAWSQEAATELAVDTSATAADMDSTAVGEAMMDSTVMEEAPAVEAVAEPVEETPDGEALFH
jgi:uncharacterized protein involved in copper resistance